MSTDTEQTYPDLLVPPFWGLTERLPIEAKRITEDDELTFTLDPAILYCYFPIITDNEQVIFLDPYDETTVIFTLSITGSQSEIIKRFRPEGDVAIISAVTLGFPSTDISQNLLESAVSELSRIAGQEIRKGLSLPIKRGELLSFSLLDLSSEEMQDVVSFMGIGDRLDPQFESKPCSVTTELGLFVHNSSVE